MVKAIRMAIEVPDLLRQVLNSRHAVQQFVPVFWLLASLVSASGFHGCTSLLGLLHLSSLILPPLCCHGRVSQKMALRPRPINFIGRACDP